MALKILTPDQMLGRLPISLAQLKEVNNSEKLNPIQDGLFLDCSRMGGAKIGHICPIMMKLGTVIPYPKKTQKIYESRDTPLELC